MFNSLIFDNARSTELVERRSKWLNMVEIR